VQICFNLKLNCNIAFSPEGDGDELYRVRLFWHIFMYEKLMSLRLGRPSVIRERDITVKRLDNRMNIASESASAQNEKGWIEWAMLHGTVYDELLSPRALLEPATVRGSKAMALAAELQSIFDLTHDMQVSRSNARPNQDSGVHHDVES
jgi:hypothetical protein